jgi:hypothetical protein
MSPDTITFYESLEGFTDFSCFHQSAWYHPLPDDWCVVITDVRGSTKAIEQGCYKEVNALGVASIVALLNAIKPVSVPYVFGGDGATACFPGSVIDRVKPALVASKKLAMQQFDMDLRIGVVRMHDIRQQGHEVCVAKYQPHADYRQAMFLGDGLGYAEKLIKNPDPNNPYLIRDLASADNTIFTGFECRWNEIPSPHDEIIALLVQVLVENSDEQSRIYAEILNHIDTVYINEAYYHPLREIYLTLTSSFRLLMVEAGIRTAFESSWKRLKYLFKLQLLRIAGIWLMKHNTRTDSTDWGEYKRNLILNSDYRKFDEMLRMVISGSEAQRIALRRILETYRSKGKIIYGIHAAPSALITCVVNNYDKDHVHFLDCAGGGYAMAAREMKQQKTFN